MKAERMEIEPATLDRESDVLNIIAQCQRHKLAYHGMVVDGKSRSVLPVYEEVWNVVIVVIPRSRSTEQEHITHIPSTNNVYQLC